MPAQRPIILTLGALALIASALGATGSSAGAGPAQLPTDQAVTHQINVAHTGNQPSDTLTPPLSERWRRTFANSVSYPLIADGRVFVTVANSGSGPYGTRLFALDESTGLTLFAGDGSLTSAPVAVGKRIYVGSANGTLYAVNGRTGLAVWHSDVGAAIQRGECCASPDSGLGAGEGWLVVPASNQLIAYQ